MDCRFQQIEGLLRLLARRDRCGHDAQMARRRPSLANEAADAFLRLTTGAGFLAGLFWAANHPVTPTNCTGTSSDSLGKCMGDTLWTTFQPYLVGIGGGTLAGALLAVLVIVVIRLSAHAFQRAPGPANGGTASGADRPVVASASVAGPRGRSMIARYPGTCSGCRSSIRPGDRITHIGRQNNRCAACG
ncbi:hypothetical protein [Patulibacter sp.]|uniref:hypothetical protein n=1 Tax=Patulibacter sp. TaxID=1912859 RepID=UPI0027287270|nr:hypothetical protein [Patulibacter sp.]MDO9406936.1 hypothetical protein [Patulibacter sp.]